MSACHQKLNLVEQAAVVTDELYGAITEFAEKYPLRSRREWAAPDLSVSQADALGALVRSAPLSMSDLAARQAVSSAAVNKLVQTLAPRGWGVQEPDRADGRVARVRGTPKGRRCCDRLPARIQGHLAEALKDLPQGDRQTLARGLVLLNAAVDGGRAEVAAEVRGQR